MQKTILGMRNGLSAIWLAIRTFIAVILILFVGIFCFVPALFLVAIVPEKKRRDSKLLFRFLQWTYCGVTFATVGPVRIEGLENLPHEPAIFVANHESALDIPVIGCLLHGRPHVWYVLDRFAKTPILGFFVRRMSVSVTQECPLKASRALIQGIRLVNGEPRHTIIFPEGGRYIDGTIHDFFSGFAIIAKRTGRPVVPVMMYNLGKILPAGALLIRPHPVHVVVGKPFVFEATDTTETFCQRVRSWFVTQSQRQ